MALLAQIAHIGYNLPLPFQLLRTGKMTELDRVQLQKDILALYAREHAELGESGTKDHLERGRHWDLSGTLKNGGVLVFPHAGVADCGYQIAACVHAALDSGTDQVLVISVLLSLIHI
jgi:hypothetical protein